MANNEKAALERMLVDTSFGGGYHFASQNEDYISEQEDQR